MKTNKKYQKFFVLALYFLVPFLILITIKYFTADNEYQPLSKAEIVKTNNDIKNLKLPDTVDFNFHINPTLSDRFFLCYGLEDKDTRETGLRFDTKEDAYSALGEQLNRRAIISGNTGKSELVNRITELEDKKLMPLKTSNLSLSEYEK